MDQPHSRGANRSAAVTVPAAAGEHAQSGTHAGHHKGSDGSDGSVGSDGTDGTKQSCVKAAETMPADQMPKAEHGAMAGAGAV